MPLTVLSLKELGKLFKALAYDAEVDVCSVKKIKYWDQFDDNNVPITRFTEEKNKYEKCLLA